MFSPLVTLVSIVERKEFRKGILTIHSDEHQGGTICGAIEGSRRSLKSIDIRVFANFRDRKCRIYKFLRQKCRIYKFSRQKCCIYKFSRQK